MGKQLTHFTAQDSVNTVGQENKGSFQGIKLAIL